MGWQVCFETAFFIAWQVFQSFIGTIHKLAASAGHDIAVHIHRIYRVCNSYNIGFCKDFLHIAGIALGTVADKDFIRRDIAAPVLEIMLGNGFSQEKIALFGTITAESFHMGHFIYSLVHSFNDSRSQGLGHVPDAQGNNIRIGMCFHIGILLLSHCGKQIGPLKI